MSTPEEHSKNQFEFFQDENEQERVAPNGGEGSIQDQDLNFEDEYRTWDASKRKMRIQVACGALVASTLLIVGLILLIFVFEDKTRGVPVNLWKYSANETFERRYGRTSLIQELPTSPLPLSLRSSCDLF
jgi:hypothetical protein